MQRQAFLKLELRHKENLNKVTGQIYKNTVFAVVHRFCCFLNSHIFYIFLPVFAKATAGLSNAV